MAPRTRDERDEIIRQLTVRERELASESTGAERKLELFERVLGLLKIASAALIAITLWAARLQWTQADHDRTIERNGARITTLEQKVGELWFMKEHGINNTPPKTP